MSPLEELRFLILAAQREGSRTFTAALRPLGLTPSQAEVLRVLADFGPMSLARLGTLLVCEGGSPSRLVGSMVARGLVARTRASEDGRAVELDLTAHGAAASDQVRACEDLLAARLSGALSADEAQQTSTILRRLLADSPAGQAVARRRAGPKPRDGR